LARDVKTFSLYLECFQLKLRLAHITCEEVEITKFLNPHSGVTVDWVKPLVDFNLKKDILLPSLVNQELMFFESFHHWLGGHHVQTMVQSSRDNLKMGIIRSEDRADITRLSIFQGSQISFGVNRLVLKNKIKREKSMYVLPEEIGQNLDLEGF
jgi:hypothetical protein